jgi:uncharacterized protein
MKKSSRRHFLKSSAIGAGSILALRSLPARSAPSATKAMTPALSTFGYAQVQLLEGPLRQQFEHNHELFLNLDEDALLKPFRQRSGLPAPGPDMGGWYDNFAGFDPSGDFHGFIPGHSFGQYLSGLARTYAITGSKPTQEKVSRLVQGYAQTVEPSGKFYVDYHLPAYTFDKTCCGLIDAHEFAQDPAALDVLWRSTQAVLPFLPERALNRAEQRARPHKDIAYTWDETYTLPENFFLAYQRSGNPRYRELGLRFVEGDYFYPLSEGKNILPGEHAYSHVNALSSAMQTYFVTGNEEYLRAARNGFRMVEEQSFATGGWGPNEAFVEPGKGLLAESLQKTHSSFETPCGAYGHFKITRYLLRVTRDPHYGDSMERILYNTIAGARPIQPDGKSFYYSDYNNTAAKKGWHNDKWPCCSGTFPQLTADYGISSYFQSSGGIYVNLFLPSKLSCTQGRTPCTLTQKTHYPAANTTQLELTLTRPETFSIYVRIPAWAGAKSILSVNGKRVENALVPGTFLPIQRTWKNGDRIEFEMEMPLRLEAIEDSRANIVALMRGPLALFAIGETPTPLTRDQLLSAAPVSGTSDDWLVRTASGNLTFRPFAAINDETYRLYQEVNS